MTGVQTCALPIFNEVVRTLSGVYPHDWATFLTTRIKTPGQPAPMAGITTGGYRLVWKDKPNSYDEGRMTGAKVTAYTYSLGITLDAEAKVTAVRWDSPAFDAGLVTGSQIIAINDAAYTADGLKEAITAAKGGKEPIRFIVKRGDSVRPLNVDWHGGLRYPWLERIGSAEGGLDRLLAPRARIPTKTPKR